MPLTDWRLHESAGVLYIQYDDTSAPAARLEAFQGIADLARGHAVTALVVEPRLSEFAEEIPAGLAHHEAVAALVAEAGVAVFVLVSRRATGDSRHLVFALQRSGVTARRASGREGALTLARRLAADARG